MTQAISYGLTTAEKARRFAMEPAETTELAFPMTSDRTTARMNLVSGLLDDVAYNAARKVENVSLYEQGRVFCAIRTMTVLVKLNMLPAR